MRLSQDLHKTCVSTVNGMSDKSWSRTSLSKCDLIDWCVNTVLYVCHLILLRAHTQN